MSVDVMETVELLMEMFVNNSGVPPNTSKPMLDGRIVGGTITRIEDHPHQVWPIYGCSV
jgi:hypothetical protein